MKFAMYSTIVALVALAGPMTTVATAQTPQAEPILAPIVRTERVGAGVVRVVYDLRGAAGSMYAVSLEASTDGGHTFTIRPRAVTGDVGPGVAVGTGKTVAWDSTKDVEDLQIDRYVFRVVVSPNGAPSAGSPGAAPAATPLSAAGEPQRAKPTTGTTAGAKKTGGLSKGAITALAGGGAAAAGAGLALKGGGSSHGTTQTPPTVLSGSHTYAGPFSGQVVITFTGTQPCTRTESGLGTLRLTLLITNGTVSGTASAGTSGSVTAVTCGGGPQLNDARGFGSFSAAVTGTTAALGFSVRVMHPHEDGTVATLDWKFSGTLSGNTVSGTLTMDMSQASPAGLQFTQFTSAVTARETP